MNTINKLNMMNKIMNNRRASIAHADNGGDVNHWQDAFEAVTQESIAEIRSHPFLRRCRDGSIRLAELKQFVLQHGHYSAYFTRCLCALMSNLPGNAEVRALAVNLFEELGLDHPHTLPHSVLYQHLMAQLGLGLTLDQAPIYADTENLISMMQNACRDPNPAFGLGALGLGAEALAPAMYADLIEGFRACGVAEQTLAFFRIHVACDDGHAATMRAIMVDLAGRDAAQASVMIGAGRALAQARSRFFSGIVQRMGLPA